MSGAQTSVKREYPALGVHRDEVLSQALGMSTEAIAGLEEAGAFGKTRVRASAGCADEDFNLPMAQANPTTEPLRSPAGI